MWQLQKVEPPHGAITPWDAHPDFSEAENLNPPHTHTALEFMAKANPQHSLLPTLLG